MSHPTVQLRHTLPDGSAHIDWMIASDPDGSSPLWTFRVAGRLEEMPAGGTLDAERIGDHRPDYLDYEGLVSGDRGRVERLARGTVEIERMDADTWCLQVEWRNVTQRLRLVRQRGVWRVLCVERQTRYGEQQEATP